jgi:hypothetical protein
MKQRSSQIAYLPENIPDGARVRIFTTNPVTLKAIHDFLRFQIREHRTGDPITITESRGKRTRLPPAPSGTDG